MCILGIGIASHDGSMEPSSTAVRTVAGPSSTNTIACVATPSSSRAFEQERVVLQLALLRGDDYGLEEGIETETLEGATERWPRLRQDRQAEVSRTEPPEATRHVLVRDEALAIGPRDGGGPMMRWGEAGPGRWITVYAHSGHAYIVVAGYRFDTSMRDPDAPGPATGPRWSKSLRKSSAFVARHPARY